MKRPRLSTEPFLWLAVTAVFFALIAAGIFTNVTLRSVEKNLPSTLFEQVHHLSSITENLADALSAAELTRAAPSPDHFARLRDRVAAVQSSVIELRKTYVFDNLIQSSAFHAVVAPAIADVQLWLIEGVSGFGPETDTTLDVILSRLREALRKGRELNQSSQRGAQTVLSDQRNRLEQFLSSVNLLFTLAGAITFILVLLLVRQRRLQRRETEAQAERRRAEQSLRESEARLGSIFRAAPIGIGLVSERVLLQVNDRLCEMTGYSSEELVGRSARILYPSDDEFHRVGREKYAQIQERGTGTLETSWKRKDGSIIDVLLSSTPLDPDHLLAGVSFTALDITERRRAETALRESRQRFKETADLLPETIFEMDVSGNLTYVNQKAFDHFGYSQEDLEQGLNCFSMIAPEDRPKALDNVKRLLRGEVIGLNEYRAQRKDGSTFPAVIHTTVQMFDGEPAGLRGIVIDITETKRLEAQLRQAHKMEAVGTLAGGIAHDFNNLLQVIQGYSELLILDKNPGDPGCEELDQINRAAKRGSELTRQLLTFSRKVESRLQPVDLNGIVENVRGLLERTIPKMIGIELRLTGSLHHINADASQIEQILMNLAVNARDAMPEGGKLVVETRNAVIDEDAVRAQPEVKPGKYVLLSVADTGRGMDQETLEHIFEPFFTTKEVGKGTGLGLAMVYGIVKNHHGHIRCRSVMGEGTVFEVFFPGIEELETSIQSVTVPVESRLGSETILLVDDEESVRKLGAQMLRKFGYSVLDAADGESALRSFREGKGLIDLVILDVIMPGMGGRQCLQKILDMDPAAKVIIASGHADSDQAQTFLEMGARAFIDKPYNVKRMLEVVREVLQN